MPFTFKCLILILLTTWGYIHSTKLEVSGPVHETIVTLKDHKFYPSELILPANVQINLLVKNLDDTTEEFESHDLKREKLVMGKSDINIRLGPLNPGEYKFFGEFHESTAQGTIKIN